MPLASPSRPMATPPSLRLGRGLQIIVSKPRQPDLSATYDTTGYADGVTLADGNAFVADQASGLQIIDVNPASSDPHRHLRPPA